MVEYSYKYRGEPSEDEILEWLNESGRKAKEQLKAWIKEHMIILTEIRDEEIQKSLREFETHEEFGNTAWKEITSYKKGDISLDFFKRVLNQEEVIDGLIPEKEYNQNMAIRITKPVEERFIPEVWERTKRLEIVKEPKKITEKYEKEEAQRIIRLLADGTFDRFLEILPEKKFNRKETVEQVAKEMGWTKPKKDETGEEGKLRGYSRADREFTAIINSKALERIRPNYYSVTTRGADIMAWTKTLEKKDRKELMK